MHTSGARAKAFDRLRGVPHWPSKSTHAPASSALASAAKTALFLIVLALVACILRARSANLQGTDFPDFYCAARMVMEGHGHELYDVELQRHYQSLYGGRAGTLYIHPPFETVLYLAVAWLPLRSAYLAWGVLNLAFLTLAVRALVRETRSGWDWRIVLAGSGLLVPLLLSFMEGQDSTLLLLLTVWGFAFFRRGGNFSSGCCLGLGLFKFQIVLPLVIVLAWQKRGRGLLFGFVPQALVLMGLSAAISGWSVFAAYPKFLLHLPERQPSGVFPAMMANFRGLIEFLVPGGTPFSIILIAVLSAVSLLLTLRGWKCVGRSGARHSLPETEKPETAQEDLAFAQTILFPLLVSYHLNPHDLSLLLLPLVLLYRAWAGEFNSKESGSWLRTGLLVAIFLPPLHLIALRAHVYALLALPVGALFVTIAFLLRRDGKLSLSM